MQDKDGLKKPFDLASILGIFDLATFAANPDTDKQPEYVGLCARAASVDFPEIKGAIIRTWEEKVKTIREYEAGKSSFEQTRTGKYAWRNVFLDKDDLARFAKNHPNKPAYQTALEELQYAIASGFDFGKPQDFCVSKNTVRPQMPSSVATGVVPAASAQP